MGFTLVFLLPGSLCETHAMQFNQMKIFGLDASECPIRGWALLDLASASFSSAAQIPTCVSEVTAGLCSPCSQRVFRSRHPTGATGP